MHDHDAREGHDDSAEWDERYRGDGTAPMWSGRPNGSLAAEAADLEPGTALDVGCGEGADAVWLAQQGWQVTALDPSAVALDRARQAATRAGETVAWLHAGLLDAPADIGPFDLVSAQYPAIRLDAQQAAVRALVDLVGPGGTLLFVHHLVGADHGDHGFDPDDYVLPADVRAALGDDWEVEVDETRPRPGPLPAEARHVDDVVLRARRSGTTAIT